jgi:hypothetical protein
MERAIPHAGDGEELCEEPSELRVRDVDHVGRASGEMEGAPSGSSSMWSASRGASM